MKKIEIEWNGEKYFISESEAFELGERLEDIITISELAEMSEKPKFRKLSRCYSEMLNFAGANTTPQKVHKLMMNEIKGLSENQKIMVATQAVTTLIEILMDGAPEGDESGEEKKGRGSLKAAS